MNNFLKSARICQINKLYIYIYIYIYIYNIYIYCGLFLLLLKVCGCKITNFLIQRSSSLNIYTGDLLCFFENWFDEITLFSKKSFVCHK